MIRQHKKMILLTSIATLLPILIGLLLWKQLPDSVATHWSTGNEPDGYSSKAFAVFGLPVIMLILHLVCVIATNIDPKANSINKKIFFIVLWICPVFSIIVCSTVYGYNLGYQFDIGFLCGLLIGVLYLILGNFLPTVKPNYTIGFRISWALNDADNWYHTHRFGGKCMDRRAPSDRHHAVPEYLGAYGARHPPVHFAGDLLLHVLPQGAVTVILFIVSDTNGSNTF